MGKKLTTQTFIEKAKIIHGAKFDYTLVDYIKSSTKIIIICNQHGKFMQTPNNHLRGQGCKKCSHNNLGKLKSKPKIGQSLLDKYPELCKEWSYKNKLGPESYMPMSNLKVLWICKKCNREWESNISSRSLGQGCKKCGHDKVATINSTPKLGESLLDMFPKICEEWSSKNKLGPENYKSRSGKSVWWKCRLCNNNWKTAPIHRTKGNTGCPNCSNKKEGLKKSQSNKHNCICNNFNNLKDEFSYKNDRKFETYTEYSGKKVIWICKKCNHEWESIIANRTKHKNGCPKCNSSKGEKLIEEYLLKNNIQYKNQYRITECRDKKPLPFDFAIWIDDKLRLIEYNGIQHYVQIGKYAEQFQDRIKKDKIKYDYCKQNNIPLLTISYTEYNNIEQILTRFIGE